MKFIFKNGFIKIMNNEKYETFQIYMIIFIIRKIVSLYIYINNNSNKLYNTYNFIHFVN